MISLFTILSAIICLQMITIASSESNTVSPNQKLDAVQTQLSTVDNEDLFNSDSESDENEQERRAATFLRFGRAIPASTGSFLRFGRGIPTSSGSFLRFGRSASNFLRFGRGSQSAGTFLRFGRRTQPVLSTNFNRFARKG